MDAFSEWKDVSLVLDRTLIHELIDSMVRADHGSLPIDRHVRSYYGQHSPMLWIDPMGLDHRADSLLLCLRDAGRSGLGDGLFRREQIESDVRRMRRLDFDCGRNTASQVAARLEYNLTRAFMRYCSVQRFGFINPQQVLNRLCVKDSDSLRVTYHRVFDIPVRRPGEAFFSQSVGKIRHDSIGPFLREVQPSGRLYDLLCQRLSDPSLSREQRLTTLCNIERCRWYVPDDPERAEKHVVVNIPSFTLYASDGDSLLTMRVGCGTTKTRTPLLASHIMRMDVNPQWIVPQSIAKGIVGNTGYLHRNRMFVADKKLGRLDASQASYSKIMSGEQHIVQEGGQGNSLGRIIFRFENNFSVFLHDTNTPGFFQRDNRAVSHGCVRIQRPFDFAVFLLKDKDGDLVDRIRYSMEADIRSDKADGGDGSDAGKTAKREPLDRDRLVHQVKVDPTVPLIITYYTLYPAADGTLHAYNDVYGYDQAIIKALMPYL